jgi:acetylornithine/N-succinyldiaminopimelate aminotransferase
MNFGLQPDIVSTAKGLGGGLPLGACLLGEKVQDVFAPGDHGSTFGGNPVCCAGALSVIRRLDEAFLAEVRRKGELVRGALLGAPGVEAVSGLGLMVGVKTAMSAAEAVKACMEKGVLFLTAKDRVRMLPALNIPDELLLEAVGVLKEVCSEG